MAEPDSPIFFDFDSATSEMEPTNYESFRGALLGHHPVAENLPDDVREALLAAVDYCALAYEQANADRGHLFSRLTEDVLLASVRGLELALRYRLGRGNRASLERLIDQGIESGVLASTDDHRQVWAALRQGRNQIAHGRLERPSFGVATSRVVGLVIDAVAEMHVGGTTAVADG